MDEPATAESSSSTALTTDKARSRPTIFDVAERAGVSKSLVSLVLRNGSNVSAAKRAAVLRAVEELGYKPNRAARSLVSQRTFTVGAVVSDLRNTWDIDLLASGRMELPAHGMNLLLVADQQIETDASVLDLFVDAGVDGLMCLGTLPPTAQL